jgi:hypothetical protein
VTVDLNTISGATWSADPVTFSGGQTQITLSKTTAGSVSLGGSVTAPTAMSAVCYNGATSGDCTLAFSSNACAFDAAEAGQGPGTPIFTKLAGTAFTVDVLALTAGVINTGYTGTVTVDLVDMTGQAAGTCDPAWTAIATPTTPTSPYTFTLANAGRRTFTFNYANAAKNVRVRMRSGATTACSSDNFAIRPTSFSVTSPDATNTGSSGTPAIKAGAAFGLDAASVNGYTGTALVNNYRVEGHSGALQAGSVSGTFSPASAATSYVSTGTAFSYSEVGNFRFAPWGVYDDGSFADVDRAKATPECFIDAKVGTSVDPANPNTLDGNGKYGCYFGGASASSYFGRFTPDHFGVTGTLTNRSDLATPGGTFSYMGEPMRHTLTVTAYNAGEGVTQNYAGAYAKLDATTLGTGSNWFNTGCGGSTQCMGLGAMNDAATDTGLSGRLAINTSVASPTSSWTAGVGTFTAHVALARAAATDGPYETLKFGAMPRDSDGVTLPGPAATDTTHRVDFDATTGATLASNPDGTNERRYLYSTKTYFGRLHLYNTYGSELLAPRIEYRTEYWTGNRWATNTLDSATSFAAANLATGGLTLSGIGALASGVGQISFAKAAVGAYDIAVNLGGTTADQSCNTAHPATTAGNQPWLQGFWGAPASCGSVAAWAQDPSARVRLGSPKTPYIYLRERY